jgi:FkbM family methyltransferase
MTIKHSLREMALRMGLEVRRFNAAESDHARMVRQFLTHQIDLVLDVGANDGGYGRLLRSGGYTGKILSFEPLASVHVGLTRTVASDPNWQVAPRMALGEADSQITINIAGNSASSSVLPMGQLHADAAPTSRYLGQEQVPLRRLDGVAHAWLQPARAVMLKIDTQGYEMPVLRGAPDLLKRVRGVQIELSVTALYEGQALFEEVMAHLKQNGFALWNVSPGFVDPRSGRMLQFDGSFFRP